MVECVPTLQQKIVYGVLSLATDMYNDGENTVCVLRTDGRITRATVRGSCLANFCAVSRCHLRQ